MIPERRHEKGFALFSMQSGRIKARCQVAGIGCHAMSRQEGHGVLIDAGLRPPILLDTRSFASWDVLDLLVALQTWPDVPTPRVLHPARVGAPTKTRSQGAARRAPGLATIALVDPADTRMLRLLPLCRAIQVIVADTLDLRCLVPYLRLLPHVVIRSSTRPPAYIGITPPPALRTALSPLLLPTLTALRHAPDNAAVAQSCQVSRATLMRVLSETRSTLALPAGDALRYRPAALADLLFHALDQ